MHCIGCIFCTIIRCILWPLGLQNRLISQKWVENSRSSIFSNREISFRSILHGIRVDKLIVDKYQLWNELMEHFDFWHTNMDLRKKETEGVFIWSFFSLDRWAKISVYVEFLLSLQIIYLMPIRFQFQIGLEFIILRENSTRFACLKIQTQLWCRSKEFQTDMAACLFFHEGNMISQELLRWRSWKCLRRWPLKLSFLIGFGRIG